ncbi:MAG TPA: peptidylprolyl isomerase [Thermoanaerobaculia bacterium]|nr:peptidylprolyl isomerase [Thermoanaerobaculia bacterium]
MRRLLPLALIAAACTTTPPPTPAPVTHGFTIEEEANVLALEDRREFDAAWAAAWAGHPNSLHRERLAMALGRIGPHTFADANGNGVRDAGERQSGVDILIGLAGDPAPPVRTAAAFALGEIGDAAAVETLLALASSADLHVAAEATEALSKMAARVPFERYAALARGEVEGARGMAIRYLFRFDSDAASAVAAEALESDAAPIRQEGAYALSRRPYAPARERLELLTSDPNVMIRAYAVAALGRIGQKESIDALIRAAGDIHTWVRTNAMVAIARVAANDASILEFEDVPRIIATTEDADSGARSASIDTLGYYATRHELARRRLLEIAANGTRWERELAVGAIARHLGDANPSLIPDELTSWQKVRVLQAAAAMPKNGAAFRSRYAGDPDVLVRMNVIGNIPDDAVDAETGLIRAALDHDDVMVRAAAIDRYGHSKSIAPEEKRAMLEQMEARGRNDRDNDARLAAIRGLAGLDTGGRDAFLRPLLSDRDPIVRRVAADLIVEKLDAFRPQYTPLPVRDIDYAAVARWAREPHTATIHMTRGVVELMLLPQSAPLTAWNFAELARQKYFDDTTFMRVVPNFVIQGGDPRNDQTGGPGYAIRDEINLQKYTRGAVGMALSGPDTGGSQFFITHSPQPHLDGGYTIFGRVTNGMSGVVDQTERGDRVETITIDERQPAAPTAVSEVQETPGPLLTGELTLDQLLEILPHYVERRDAYAADATVVEMIASSAKPGDRIEVYMGTWCVDSAREVPKLLKIDRMLRENHSTSIPMIFLALDRSKAEPAELVRGKNIEMVSTFIYYRGDEELMRIVERPVSLFEDDLLAIAAR